MGSNISDRLGGFSGEAGIKLPVLCATTANITLSGEQTIDGVTTSESRVLVKDQTDTTENGIYKSSASDWTREPDFNGSRDVKSGTMVWVVSGTANGSELWYVSTASDPTPGDAMAFTQAPIVTVTTGTIATQDADSVTITGGSITGITDITVADGGTGASTFTDNAILRGQVADPIDATSVYIDDNDQIYGFKANFNNQTGTTYTVVTADTGKTITYNNASAITVTLPNNMPIGWETENIQLGAGQVTFSAGAGATLQNRQSQTKLAGQYAAARLKVTANSDGTSAVYNLAGDTAS